MTRALLAARDEQHVEKILKDDGLGVANGFSLNMIWTDISGDRKMYNIEVAPDSKADHSILNVQTFDDTGASMVHCNRCVLELFSTLKLNCLPMFLI